jgi:hypothetical protein
MVTSGSTITLAPFFNVLMNGLVVVICSAINGDTLLLMPPVPSPITIIATISPGTAAPLCTLHGRLVTNKITMPIMYTTLNHLIVLYLPKYWSATTAPITGVR